MGLYLGRLAGLRIHECFRTDTAMAEEALRENVLTVKGKGGKVRTVPIEDERIPMILRMRLEVTKRGHKLMVPDDMRTDVAITELQQFMKLIRSASSYRHRSMKQNRNLQPFIVAFLLILCYDGSCKTHHDGRNPFEQYHTV